MLTEDAPVRLTNAQLGLLKNDFGFRRFLTRGKKNVRTEPFFLALAFDLKKLWMKRDEGRLRTHLSELSAA